MAKTRVKNFKSWTKCIGKKILAKKLGWKCSSMAQSDAPRFGSSRRGSERKYESLNNRLKNFWTLVMKKQTYKNVICSYTCGWSVVGARFEVMMSLFRGDDVIVSRLSCSSKFKPHLKFWANRVSFGHLQALLVALGGFIKKQKKSGCFIFGCNLIILIYFLIS